MQLTCIVVIINNTLGCLDIGENDRVTLLASAHRIASPDFYKTMSSLLPMLLMTILYMRRNYAALKRLYEMIAEREALSVE